MKLWLEEKYTEMYSTHNEGESVIVERFIKVLKNKIYKSMTSTSKNLCIDKLGNTFNIYNNTYQLQLKWNLLI